MKKWQFILVMVGAMGVSFILLYSLHLDIDLSIGMSMLFGILFSHIVNVEYILSKNKEDDVYK